MKVLLYKRKFGGRGTRTGSGSSEGTSKVEKGKRNMLLAEEQFKCT